MALTATSGRAEEVPAEPVVVLVYGATDEFGLRLEAELRSIGVKVEPRRHAARTQPPGTIAVVTVSRRGGRRVEIRMGGHPSMQGEADLVVSVDDIGDPLGAFRQQSAFGRRSSRSRLGGLGSSPRPRRRLKW